MQDDKYASDRSYQLLIHVPRAVRFRMGRAAGLRTLEPGLYVYTGSARRGLEARVARHLRRAKRLHWHVDRLLACPGVRVIAVRRSMLEECRLHQTTQGTPVLSGFGSSDCRAGCRSHLLRIGGPARRRGPGRGWERVD